MAMAGMKQAPGRQAGRLLISAKPEPGFGEGVFVGGDGLIDRFVRGEIVVFALKLVVEPAGRLRFIVHLFLSVCNHW